MKLPVSGSRSLIMVVLVLLTASAIATVLVKTKPQPPARAISERIWTVTATVAQRGAYTPQLTLYGQIESPRSAVLTAAVTAFVAAQHVDEGSRVRQGDLLLTLDGRDARLQLASRQAQRDDIRARLQAEAVRHQSNLESLAIERQLLSLAQRSVTRIEKLKGRQVSSETQLDEALRNYQQQALSLTNRKRDIADYPARKAQYQAQLDNAETQLDSARLDLERTQIRAPFNGRIARISTAPGSRVRSGDPLLTLYQDDRLEVRAQIPSRHLAKVRAALNAKQPLSASSRVDGVAIEMQLDRLAAEVGTGRAGVDALFRVTSDHQGLVLGRTLDLQLTLPPESDLLSLPAQSLYGTDHIYRIEDGRLSAVSVNRVGEHRQHQQTRLLLRAEAINDGDQILTTQLPNAMTGLGVRIAAVDHE